MMDRIVVKDLFLRTIIGINDDERNNRQDVLINLVMETDTRTAAGRFVSGSIFDPSNKNARFDGSSDILPIPFDRYADRFCKPQRCRLLHADLHFLNVIDGQTELRDFLGQFFDEKKS